MNEKKKLYVFDFDGTLTKRDTFVEFIRYMHGTKAMLLGFARYAPVLLLMKMGLFPNGRAKRMVFTHFFGGMSEEKFDAGCQRFATEKKKLLRPNGMRKIDSLLGEGQCVVVISASMTRWVQPFFNECVSKHGETLPMRSTDGREFSRFIVTGTDVEVVDGKLTGRFVGKNCYGAEKLRRLKGLYPALDKYYLTVFGDSKGDIALLDCSDEGYYKPFRGL